jgi:hypothetical protein
MLNCKTDGNLEKSGKDTFDILIIELDPREETANKVESSCKPIDMESQYICLILTVINFVSSKF